MVKKVQNELSPELVNIVGMNPWVCYDSASRQYMLTSHLSQRLIVSGATPRRVQSGMEMEFGKYVFNIKMPVDANILRVVQKYPRTMSNDIKYNTEVLVIYEDFHTGEIGGITIPRYLKKHIMFGYELVETPALAMLTQGAFIPKDTILAQSPSIDENNSYNYGVELNAIFMSHPAIAEDGFIVSEDVLDKFTFSKYETRVLEFGQDKHLLNLYGDENNFKGFPDIGEYVRDDCILAAFREYDDDLSPSIMSVNDLMNIDHVFDEKVYVGSPTARVVNIEVHENKATRQDVPTGMETHLTKYINATKLYYQNVIDLDRELQRNRRARHDDTKVQYSPELHKIMVQAYSYLDEGVSASRVLRKRHRQADMDTYRVEIVLEHKVTPHKAFKLTGLHGNKGVIVKVEKPENMPVDKNGVRADIILDGNSVINRMNPGVAYELFIGSACNEIKFKLRDIYNLSRNAEYTREFLEAAVQDDSKYKTAKDLLIKFYGIVNEHMGKHFTHLTVDDFKEHLVNVIENGPYLHSPTNLNKTYDDIVREIDKEFKPLYDQVYIPDENGQPQLTKNKFRIGPSYFILLEKVADSWSAASTGKLQHYGVLSPTSRKEKYSNPFKTNAVRILGETEMRILSSHTSSENCAELMDRNNNPITIRKMAEKIANSKTPTNIDEAVDREVVGFGGNKPLQLTKHIFNCFGVDFVYKEGDLDE